MCTTDRLIKDSNYHHVSHTEARLPRPTRTREDSVSARSTSQRIVYSQRVQVCARRYVGIRTGQSILAARTGPQGQVGVCVCLSQTHMSGSTCTCVGVSFPTTPPSVAFDYAPHVITRDRKSRCVPEVVYFPRKSQNRRLWWNPSLHPARTH